MDKAILEHLKNKNAHSNFRRGMSDYNDGENVTHQLGNDDYKNGNNLPDPYRDQNLQLDGKEAEGNDLLAWEEFDDQENFVNSEKNDAEENG